MGDVPFWALRLRTERRERLWSQRDMARALAEVADERTRARLPGRESIIRMIKGWEAGRHKPKDPYRLLYCRAFSLSEAELFDVEDISPPEPEEQDVLRRKFLSSSIAATGITATPLPAKDLSRGRIGNDLVTSLRNRMIRLRRLDDHLGGAETYRLYAAELETTSTLVNECRYTEATGRALLSLISEQAQQAGWAAFDAGWHKKARGLFKESMSAAVDSGDTSLLANSLALLAYQKAGTGSPGVDEAEASCRMVSPAAPPTVRALPLGRAAWAYASAGRFHQTDAERSISRAREALEGGGSHPAPDWSLWVDETELQIMTGRCWAVLNQPAKAIVALEDALANYKDTHARDKSLYMTWLAEGYVESGEEDLPFFSLLHLSLMPENSFRGPENLSGRGQPRVNRGSKQAQGHVTTVRCSRDLKVTRHVAEPSLDRARSSWARPVSSAPPGRVINGRRGAGRRPRGPGRRVRGPERWSRTRPSRASSGCGRRSRSAGSRGLEPPRSGRSARGSRGRPGR